MTRLKDLFSKIVLSVVTLVLISIAIFDKDITLVTKIFIIIPMLISCPVIHWILEKQSGKTMNVKYNMVLQMIMILEGIIIAIYFDIFIMEKFLKNNSASKIWDQSKIILEITIYVMYLVILFYCSNINKKKRYILFGILYFVCTILSFVPEDYNYIIVDILNKFSIHKYISSLEYSVLFKEILIPIKEAVLTYIIFDTIFEKKDFDSGEKLVDISDKKEIEIIMEEKKSKKVYLVNIQKK